MEIIDEARWASERKEVENVQNVLRTLESSLEREVAADESASAYLVTCQQAQDILQHVAQAVQRQAHEKISSVVSSCLASVFPDNPYELKITFERKRGKTEAVLQFSRGSISVNPISASGGGVVDVAAFALRVACLVLHRPRLSRVVVLDEPFKFVSAGHLPNVRRMLQQLTKDLGLQIIMVSHIEELAIGKVVEL